MLELKLRPPQARVGQVRRTTILDKLGSTTDIPNVVLLAPPGYGKTTVMGQLEDEDQRPTAWLTLDEADSDPAILLMSLANALLSGGLIEESQFEEPSIRSDTALTHGLNELLGLIDTSINGLLLLDHVDHLSTRASLDIIGALMTRHPGRIQLVIASRSGKGLPIARLRAEGTLVGLGVDDLVMNEDEATAIFEAVGVEAAGRIGEVLRHTEGWPVGIYLTALAVNAGAAIPGDLDVHGDDIFLADYLRQELLDRIPDGTVSFLIRTSILTRLSGQFCDYVLDTQDSGVLLSDLENSNLLIVPLDRTRNWYRYHSLLRDYLRSELHRRYPHELPLLHSRAGTWLDENGQPELAIDHVAAAGEGDRFAGMVARSARRIYSEGKMDTLSGWWQWLEDSKTIANHPELAAMGAFSRGLEGNAAGSERLAVFAYTDRTGQLLDDDALGPLALMLRSFQAKRGVEQALTDAEAARDRLSQNIEWLHTCLGAVALATQATKGVEATDSIWADGLWRSESIDAHPFSSEALAQRALVSIAHGDWVSAATLSNRAVDIIRHGDLEQYVTSALGFTIAARVASRAGDVELARTLLASAAAIRPLFSVAMPLMSVQNLHEMAKALIEVADMAGARRVMRDAADIIAVRPKLGTLIGDHDELKERLASLPAGSVGASSLTTAELRLLPLLVTHLTFPEIGERLYISRHTVKTQAMSIYRKLGVSSRAHAVEAARQTGLLSV